MLALAAIGIPIAFLPAWPCLLLEMQRTMLALEGKRGMGRQPREPGRTLCLEQSLFLDKQPIAGLFSRPDERRRRSLWHRLLSHVSVIPNNVLSVSISP